MPKNGPLVVVLHGSTQSAESYNSGSGLGVRASRVAFVLLAVALLIWAAMTHPDWVPARTAATQRGATVMGVPARVIGLNQDDL